MNGVGYASPTYHALSVVMLLLCSLFLLSWLLVVGLEARSLRFKAMALATVKGPSSHRNGRAGRGNVHHDRCDDVHDQRPYERHRLHRFRQGNQCTGHESGFRELRTRNTRHCRQGP